MAAVFHSGPLSISHAFAAGAIREPLTEQTLGLAEQDTAICLEKQGRGAEAVAHYRAAIAHDPLLKAAWANLALHALDQGLTDQAVHLASIALFLDPFYDTARTVLAEARAAQAPDDARRQLAGQSCPDPTAPGGEPAGGNGSEPTVLGAGVRQACMERRAGLLAPLGAEARSAMEELSRLALEGDRPAEAALLWGVGASLASAPGSQDILAEALERSGDPCGSSLPFVPAEPLGRRCEALRARRSALERTLAQDLRPLDEPHRMAARLRLETLLASGLDAPAALRRWRMEQARGERPAADLGGLLLRLGEEWIEAGRGDASGCAIWRRRPGDSAFLSCTIETGEAGAGAALESLLKSRRPARLEWSADRIASTEPSTARFARLTAETEEGALVEGLLWLVASPALRGRALVIAAFPGTGGLGREGIDQSREEILDAMKSAVVVPSRWEESTPLRLRDELPLPVHGSRTEPDERRTPWRTFSAGEFSVALPPGMVATLYAHAPRASAPARPTALLWFRGRFKDRDGLAVVVGDADHAASVDILDMPVPVPPAAARSGARAASASGPPTPPLADPGAKPIAAVDITSTFGPLTGASRATLSTYRASSGTIEWLVGRLAFETRLVEIAIPVLEGGESIALYWIASTVRPAGEPQPDAPVDLSSSLGIAFFRPPPEERGQAFYKEGDLRSRDFTMLVARGYSVTMNSEARDAFPVRLSRPQGDALVRLDRLSGALLAGEAGDVAAQEGAGQPSAVPPADAQARLASELAEWLSREGFVLSAAPAAKAVSRPARSGAVWGLEAQFRAEPEKSSEEKGLTPPPGPAQGRTGGTAGDAPNPGAPGDIEGTIRGMGRLFLARDGNIYIFMALRMGAEARQRGEEIQLMVSSLRLNTKRR